MDWEVELISLYLFVCKHYQAELSNYCARMSHYADLRFSDEEAITLYLYAKDKQKFHGDRYEFWIYRQMKKRLKAGELYLSDSIHHRSLQQEISSANEKGALVQPNQNIIG